MPLEPRCELKEVSRGVSPLDCLGIFSPVAEQQKVEAGTAYSLVMTPPSDKMMLLTDKTAAN